MNTTTISMTHEVYPPNCNSRKDNSGIFLLCKKRTVRLGRFFKPHKHDWIDFTKR